jgi:CheY-like chemotaxis protein
MARKILVVDDNRTTRYMLSYSLRQEGYDVFEASNGAEAAKRLQTESFDLVLSDYSMPGMNGLRLAMHISRIAPQTPIIILSGSLDITHDDVVNAGGFDFVQKPVILNSLIGKIEIAFATGTLKKLEWRDFLFSHDSTHIRRDVV